MLDQGQFSAAFDAVCLRRQALIPRRTVTYTGWAFARPSATVIDRIDGVPGDGSNPGQSLITARFPRPDVQQGFAKAGITAPADSGFTLVVTTGSETIGGLRIRSGEDDLAWPDPQPGKAVSLSDKNGQPVVDAGIDTITIQDPALAGGLRHSVFHILIELGSSPLAWGLAMAAASTALGWSLWRQRSILTSPACLVLATLFIWTGCRVVFYGTISAGAWMAEPRYLQTGTVFLTALLTIALLLPCATPVRRKPAKP